MPCDTLVPSEMAALGIDLGLNGFDFQDARAFALKRTGPNQ